MYAGGRVVRRRTREEISNAAREIRKSISNEKGYFDVLRYVENVLPTTMCNFSMLIVDKEDAENTGINIEGVQGLTVVEDNGGITMYIPQETYDSARRGNGAARYTVAHELAHVIMHSTEAATMARLEAPRYERYNSDKRSDPEWQANEFAAELLAPAMLLNGLKEIEVMEIFGVSRTVASIQKSKRKS